LQKLGYAVYSKVGSSDGVHTITESGKDFLQTNIDALEYLVSGDFTYDDVQSSFAAIPVVGEQRQKILVYDENLVIEEGTRRVKNIPVYERSKKLREAAINRYTINGHLKCSVCLFDFYVVYGERGRGYIEIHHQKPIFQYEDQDITKFIEQALQNVVPVCSNCHRMIHREKNAPMPIEELRQLVQNARNTHTNRPTEPRKSR
jgi:predicted HNH restriction endonuclease